MSSTELPTSIKAAWGLRERPSRGPRPALTLSRIIDAAIVVADSAGIEALSMGRVAEQLRASPMALYRYVAAKEELLMLMVDTAYGEPPTMRPEDGWRLSLSRWARAHLGPLRQHPWVLHIPYTGLPILPNQVAWMEQALSSMGGTGLPEAQKLSTVILVSGFIRTTVLPSATMNLVPITSGTSKDEAIADYSRKLGRITVQRQFPALAAALDAGAREHPSLSDNQFAFGLDLILDGVEALIQRSADRIR